MRAEIYDQPKSNFTIVCRDKLLPNYFYTFIYLKEKIFLLYKQMIKSIQISKYEWYAYKSCK